MAKEVQNTRHRLVLWPVADDVISLCCSEYTKYEEIFPEGSKSKLEMELSQSNLYKLVSQTDFLRITKYLCFYYPLHFSGGKNNKK